MMSSFVMKEMKSQGDHPSCLQTYERSLETLLCGGTNHKKWPSEFTRTLVNALWDEEGNLLLINEATGEQVEVPLLIQ